MIKKRPSKMIGWEKLILNSRLGKRTFLTSYKLYCNFAHSEYSSAMQFRAYLKNQLELQNAVSYSLLRSAWLISMLIKDLTKKYEKLRLFYNDKPETLKAMIDLFDKTGEKV